MLNPDMKNKFIKQLIMVFISGFLVVQRKKLSGQKKKTVLGVMSNKKETGNSDTPVSFIFVILFVGDG